MQWLLPRFASSSSASDPAESMPQVLAGHSVDISSPAEALRHFEYPGLAPPPSARVGDPKLKQRESQPLKLWHLWKFGTFAAMKATTLAADVVSHQIWGPRRKSWGIEMTLLSSMMRGVNRYSHLMDIETMRMLMSIGGLVPVPSDALVTPVTFSVRKRQLRGILAEFDAVEDGKRELSGEWVVGKRTWKRLQSEWRARKGGKPGKGKKKERVVLYLHGGGYYLFSPATHRLITIPLAKYLDARLFAVDYRLAPETKFPGPLHDAVSAYFRLVDDLHVPPENIIVAGDSAGGGLTLALVMYLRDNDYPLPSGTILMSPWVDLTLSCESWDSNAQYDIVPMPQPGDHLNPILPLFGDFKGLPPMLIQSGEVEVLRDEITLLAHKASLAGVEVRHELYEDMVHVFQSFPFLEAAKHAFVSCHDFVWNFLPQRQNRTPQYFEPSAEKGLEDEIDTKATRVVRGDGTETGQGPEAIEEPSESKRRPSYRRKSYSGSRSPTPSLDEPSWGSMYLPSSSDDEGDFGDGAVRVDMYAVPTRAPTLEVPRPTLSKAPSFSRLRATFSTIADPSICRSQRSHPDISSLCQSWTKAGPANYTRTYKPDHVSTAQSEEVPMPFD
ncbi:Alpha/Beta hydrolase protein [Fomes fomentarius]|nr:Alpha/Beta hydrolase protein [Fomes fomentarius]